MPTRPKIRPTTTAPKNVPKKTAGKERLLRKTSLGFQYVVTSYDGTNRAKIKALSDTVLVMCDKPVTKSAGGIILTEETQENHRAAAETGVVVDVGEGAFCWNGDGVTPYQGTKPKAGDRVYFTRYAGQLVIGADGLEYRVMTSNCVGGLEVGGGA